MKLGVILIPEDGETIDFQKIRAVMNSDTIEPKFSMPILDPSKKPAKKIDASSLFNEKAEKEMESDPLDEGVTKPDQPDSIIALNPNKEELMQKLTELRDSSSIDGKGILKNILVSFGAKRFGELAKEDWPSVYSAAVEALKPVEPEKPDNNFEEDFGLDDDDLDEAPTLDRLDLKVRVQAVGKRKGQNVAIELLKRAGLNSVRGLKTASADVLARVDKELAAFN